MIELIIVIAIIGILSAILVPSFTSMSRKSRMRADISTIKQVQTQIDLFMAENEGKHPIGTVAAMTDADTKITLSGDLADGKLTAPTPVILARENYIKASDVDGDVKAEATAASAQKIKLQSKDVELHYNKTKEHLELSFKQSKELTEGVKADPEWVSATPRT